MTHKRLDINFLQKFTGWQIQINFALNDLVMQGLIENITLRSSDSGGGLPVVVISTLWMIMKYQGGAWEQAVTKIDGNTLEIGSYEFPIQQPVHVQETPNYTQIIIPEQETIIWFLRPGHPSSIPDPV